MSCSNQFNHQQQQHQPDAIIFYMKSEVKGGVSLEKTCLIERKNILVICPKYFKYKNIKCHKTGNSNEINVISWFQR